jgi:trans-2,3-dihydro-3-hydroxyanthranilate isomerase
MNYSETTFVISDEEQRGGYDVRIFTPETEVPFAGHPTLGTAYVIQREMIKEPIQQITLNLKAGQIPVMFSSESGHSDLLWMKQLPPVFGQTFDPKAIIPFLSLKEGDIDTGFPVQEVSTGLPFIIVPMKTLDAVQRSTIIQHKLFEFLNSIQGTTRSKPNILIFSPETYKPVNDLTVRVFADSYGIPEDPATGSGNGCLAAYLVKHRYFGSTQINIRVEQGYAIGRPSLLLLKTETHDDQIDVFVGGRVIMIAKGELV